MSGRKEALEALRDKVKAGFWTPDELMEGENSADDYFAVFVGNRPNAWRAYHGSIDAAKALHEAVLPGWRYSIAHGPSGDAVVVAKRLGEQVDTLGVATDNPARAWLLAILSALISEATE